MEHEMENILLRQIISDIWWMARRYADGRSTYATGMFNSAIRKAESLGVELNPKPEKTIFARDGMGPGYAGLTQEEYDMGEPVDQWSLHVVPEEVKHLREQLATLQAQSVDQALLVERLIELLKSRPHGNLCSVSIYFPEENPVCNCWKAYEMPSPQQTIGVKALELVRAAIRRDLAYKGAMPLNEFLESDNTLDSVVASFTESEIKTIIGG